MFIRGGSPWLNKPDTMVAEVRLVNDQMGLELLCNDAVDFHEPVYFRRITVRDKRGARGVGGAGENGNGNGDHRAPNRDVRLFYHIDLSIKESPVGDTCDFDPATRNGIAG